jgi:7-carboxy-7-deazaguanine synthase
MNLEVQKKVNGGLMLPLMEQFYTIQGEGFHTGKAAYFIRIGGCDVGCHWCDVKESWNANLHPPTAIEEIINSAQPYSNTVVVTGGEPLTWDMAPLTQALKQVGKTLHIETSGAYPLSGTWDWICLSPKKTKPPKPEFYEAAHELKVVIFNKSDFLWAEEHAAKVGPECKLFLQPEWSKRETMIPLISAYVMEHTQWQVGLQTHKYLGLP